MLRSQHCTSIVPDAFLVQTWYLCLKTTVNIVSYGTPSWWSACSQAAGRGREFSYEVPVLSGCLAEISLQPTLFSPLPCA